MNKDNNLMQENTRNLEEIFLCSCVTEMTTGCIVNMKL